MKLWHENRSESQSRERERGEHDETREGEGNPQLFEEVDFGPGLGFHRVDSHESSLESVRSHPDVSLRIFSQP